MVLAASRHDDLVITEADLRRAEAEVSFLEGDMSRVFGIMNKEKITQLSAEMMLFLRNNAPIAKTDFMRFGLQRLGHNTLNEILDGLLSAGLISLDRRGSEIIITYKAQETERRLIG